MAITEDQAAAIAKRHGLGLADALSLKDLARDEEHAESIAEQFAPAKEESDSPETLADAVSRQIRGH